MVFYQATKRKAMMLHLKPIVNQKKKTMIIIKVNRHSTEVRAYIGEDLTYKKTMVCGGMNLYEALSKKYSGLKNVTTEKILIEYDFGGGKESIKRIINSTVKPPPINKYKNLPGVRYIPDKLITLAANGWIYDKDGNKRYITDKELLERKINKAETLIDLFYTGRINVLEFRTKLDRII